MSFYRDLVSQGPTERTVIYCFHLIFQKEWPLIFIFVVCCCCCCYFGSDLLIIWPGLCILGFFFYKKSNVIIWGCLRPLHFLLGCKVRAEKQYFSWQMAHVFHFSACLKTVYTQMYFIFWRNCVFQATPPPQPAVSFLRPKVFCVATIRSLFLEIYDSFSEIRRDLCSSYFYCKSNSLEKNVICTKALFLS